MKHSATGRIPDSAIRQGQALLLAQNSAKPLARHCDEYDINAQDIGRDELMELYSNDSLLQQAVDTPVLDALTNWREGVDHDEQYKLKKHVIKAIRRARLLRHAAIVPILLDSEGKAIALSVNLDRAVELGATIDRFIVIDSIEMSEEVETDVFSANHGKPKSYSANNKPIHFSRLIVFSGSVSEKSAAESFLYYFKKFHEAYEEMMRAMGEANVWALGTDIDALKEAYEAAQQVGNSTKKFDDIVGSRLNNFRGAMNSAGAYLYDKNSEELEKHPVTNLDGLVKGVDQTLSVLCAAVNISPSQFLGRSQGALGGSNTTEIYNSVQASNSLRTLIIEDPLSDLDAFISAIEGKEQPAYTWNPTPIEALAEAGNESVAKA